MVLMFEVAGPFRWKPKVERVGALTRIIWGCFSVARIAAGFNDIARTFREDEREICAGICDRFQARGMQPAECAGAIRMRSNAELCGVRSTFERAPG